jgi:hypothetical protein
VSVRVDPNTSATFLRPGSNFRLTFWTSNLAFSSRAAVVARGVLYYWGPTGIYRDVGNELADKMFSLHIEPWVHTLYDTSRTDDIHSVYNDKTKEVIWFFPPKKTGSQVAQMALVYNTEFDSFFLFNLGSTIVDNSQILDVQLNRTNNNDTEGQRVALYVRDATNLALPQQMVFFDELCDSGDVRPANIAFVSAVAIQGANRRLTVAVTSGALPTSGKLTVNGYNGYADVALSSGNPDAIYDIVGGNGTSFIDIAPVGGSWVGNDFQIGTIGSVTNRFPITWEAAHGFVFSMLSDYLCLAGMRTWLRWMYCYQSFKVDTLARSTSPQQVRINFRTILGTGASVRDITLDCVHSAKRRLPSPVNRVDHSNGDALRVQVVLSVFEL